MSSRIQETNKERERRAYIESLERYLDCSERYEQELATAASPEERTRIMSEFSHQRSAYRETENKAGRRPAGASCMIHQIMWVRWIEIAVEQELQAARSFLALLEGGPDPRQLLAEFHASLLAVTASAYTIDAVYAEVKYRIPPPSHRPDKRDSQLSHAFAEAFGLLEANIGRLKSEIHWLFELRDKAVHPYTEPSVPEKHPAGFQSGIENSLFNTVTSGRAVDTAMLILGIAASPPTSLNRWIKRWAKARNPYMQNVVRPLQIRRDTEHRPILDYLANNSVE